MAETIYSTPPYSRELSPDLDHLYPQRLQSFRQFARQFFIMNGPARPNPKGKQVSASGYLYFARRADGQIKIGATSYPKKRLVALRKEHGDAVEYLLAVKGAARLERYYHETFRQHRQQGEWFAPDQSLLDEIEELRAGKLERGQ